MTTPSPTNSAPTSAYVHIPFCAAKCGYCDFNSYAGIMRLASRYVDALCAQISSSPALYPGCVAPLETVFFGGGTPSILPAGDLTRILRTLRDTFGLEPDAEVTMEANPESATYGKLCSVREGGFNRLSMGAQSFDDATLERLGRVHTHERFLQALSDARRAGFENVSFDLMFGLPGQTLDDVQDTVRRAIELGPDHISAYCLTIEEDTAFYVLTREGKLDLPDEDLQAEMFLAVREGFTRAGFEHYEISNYARAGMRCRHNMAYWDNAAYWGFGTGAVGYVDGERVKWEVNPEGYIRQIEETGAPEASFRESLQGGELLGETAMLALRTIDGLDLTEMSRRFGVDAEKVYAPEIGRFTAAGLLTRTNGHIALTPPGLLVANDVMAEFLR